MEESKFDQFIRNISKTPLEVPSGMEWEEMNISTAPRKRRYLAWILPLLITTGVGVYMFSSNQKLSSKESAERSEMVYPELANDVEANSNEEETLALEVNQPSTDRVTEIEELGKKELKIEKTTSKHETPPTSFISLDNPNKSEIIHTKLKDDKLSAETEGLKLVDAEINHIIKTELAEEPKSEKLERLGSRRSYLQSLMNLSNELSFSTEESPFNRFTLKKPTVQIMFGLTSYNSNAQGHNLSSNSIGSESIGQYVSLSLVKNDGLWQYTYGLTYSKLHHYYMGNRIIGHANDEDDHIRTHFNRNVFNNNYINVLSLRLGAERSVALNNKWSMYISSALQPGVKLNSTGKTFDPESNELFNISELSQKVQPTLALSLGTGLRYKYSDRSQFFIMPEYSRHIFSFDVTQDVSSKISPDVLMLSVGLNYNMH